MATANPLFMQDIQTTTGGNQFYEGLFRLDEKNVAQPALAVDYQVSQDGLTYTFQLQEDAKWSNGDPVTAHDFVYGWQKAVDPDTAAPYAYMFEPVVNAAEINRGEMESAELGIEATSDTELVVQLNVPVSYLPEMLTNPYFFPLNEAFVEEQGDAYGTSAETTLSNGHLS
ncbi:ABC transporter substrate-binding protein [Desemzia sp. FAM 23991]|uniref:ABC transporter substrate-binding protein n=1 Tax=unclassified Desemzia TaxID=2685243 RepID=UPI0038884D70